MSHVINALKKRNGRMKKLKFYFCQQNVTKATKRNFRAVTKTGTELLELLKSGRIQGFKTEIEKYLVACEESLLEVGIELSGEFCEICEILDDFRDERLLMMKFVNDELNEEMFK